MRSSSAIPSQSCVSSLANICRLAAAIAIASMFFLGSSIAVADTPLSSTFGVAEEPAHLRITATPLFEAIPGYVPIRIVMESLVNNPVPFTKPLVLPGPAPRERVIDFTVTESDAFYGFSGSGCKVTGTITIPKGAMSAETIVNVPIYKLSNYGNTTYWYVNSIALSERGRPFKGSPYYSDTVRMFPGAGPGAARRVDAQTGVLFVHSAIPKAADRDAIEMGNPRFTPADDPKTYNIPDFDRMMVEWNPMTNTPRYGAPRLTDWELTRSIGKISNWALMEPSELPEQWSQLSSRGLLIISASELEALAKTSPAKVSAIVHWLRTGTGMVVYGVGSEFEKVAPLEKSLGISSASLPKPEDGQFDRSRWNLFDPNAPLSELTADSTRGPAYARTSTSTNDSAVESGGSGNGKKFKPVFQSRVRLIGLGALVVIDKEDPFVEEGDPSSTDPASVTKPTNPPSAALARSWQEVFNNITQRRLVWESRTDLDLRSPSNFYWNMLIPGVGAAPVLSFMVLVTLFVVLIGPVNFTWLRARKQPVLILITVPLAGALTTILLFVYAIAKDGISTRSRVRSYTHLDQNLHAATSWSRQTYYAAIAPANGYEFGANDVVIPVVPQGSNNRFQDSQIFSEYSLRWLPDKQQLGNDFLKSRSFSQLLVIHSEPTESRLIITPPKGTAAPKATNKLAGMIDRLYVRDMEGNYLKAREINLDATSDLLPIDASDVAAELRQLLDKSEPQMPVGFDADRFDRGLLGFNVNYYSSYSPVSRGGVNIGLQAIQSLKSLNTLPDGTSGIIGIKPREFVAIVRYPKDVPMGLQNTTELSSLHVIAGNW